MNKSTTRWRGHVFFYSRFVVLFRPRGLCLVNRTAEVLSRHAFLFRQKKNKVNRLFKLPRWITGHDYLIRMLDYQYNTIIFLAFYSIRHFSEFRYWIGHSYERLFLTTCMHMVFQKKTGELFSVVRTSGKREVENQVKISLVWISPIRSLWVPGSRRSQWLRTNPCPTHPWPVSAVGFSGNASGRHNAVRHVQNTVISKQFTKSEKNVTQEWNEISRSG